MYIFSTFLCPSIYINKIIFSFLLVNTLLILPCYIAKNSIFINPLVIQFIFIYGYLVASFTNCNQEFAIQFLFAPLNLFLIYLILYYQINLSVIIRKIGVVLSLFVISIFIIYQIDQQLYNVIEVLLKLYLGGTAGASERDFMSADGSNMLLFTLPGSYHLFLPLLIYFCRYLTNRSCKTLLCFVIVFFAVVISGARGQWLISVFLLYMIYFFSTTYKNRIYSVVLISVVLLFLFYYLYQYTMFFSTDEVSNGIKIAKVTAFFQSLDWLQLFIGNGLGAYYHVPGIGNLSHTELTLFDQVRYVGLFLTIIYVFAIICPIWFLPQQNLKLKLLPLAVCLGLLVYSFTNPVLMNSLGHIVILWYWSKQFADNENKCLSGYL